MPWQPKCPPIKYGVHGIPKGGIGIGRLGGLRVAVVIFWLLPKAALGTLVDLPRTSSVNSRRRRTDMTRVKELAKEVQALTSEELAAFRQWFEEYASSDWDRQIEEDALAGKFDELARKAISEHNAGRTSEI